MWERFVARMLNKYQWFINPLVGRRDKLSILMLSYDFVRASAKMKRHYNVFYDGARLVGIFFTNFPTDLFNTQLRVCVYRKRDFSDLGFGKDKYCLVYMFTHCEPGQPYKLGSHAKSDFLEFHELVAYLKSAKSLSDCRTEIFRIQQTSKKKPILKAEAS